MTKENRTVIIKKHYQSEAKKYGKSFRSTMDDDVVRERETQMILEVCRYLSRTGKTLKILDLGCGNGYTLSMLSRKFPKHRYTGIDYTKEMVDICKQRKMKNCLVLQGDARNLAFSDNSFDFVYTQRCLINILNIKEQYKALNEIYRILRHGGFYLFIECFTDGLKNNNKARQECGLPPFAARFHNLYFDKKQFLKAVKNKFRVLPDKMELSNGYVFHQNFLSSHYFVARVLHPLITKGGDIKNTEFVKFFSFLSPIGNYSQIQALLMQKI